MACSPWLSLLLFPTGDDGGSYIAIIIFRRPTPARSILQPSAANHYYRIQVPLPSVSPSALNCTPFDFVF